MFAQGSLLIRLIKTCLNETQSMVRIGNYSPSSFLTENRLKQGDALSPLVFNFVLEYVITRYRKQYGDWVRMILVRYWLMGMMAI